MSHDNQQAEQPSSKRTATAKGIKFAAAEVTGFTVAKRSLNAFKKTAWKDVQNAQGIYAGFKDTLKTVATPDEKLHVSELPLFQRQIILVNSTLHYCLIVSLLVVIVLAYLVSDFGSLSTLLDSYMKSRFYTLISFLIFIPIIGIITYLIANAVTTRNLMLETTARIPHLLSQQYLSSSYRIAWITSFYAGACMLFHSAESLSWSQPVLAILSLYLGVWAVRSLSNIYNPTKGYETSGGAFKLISKAVTFTPLQRLSLPLNQLPEPLTTKLLLGINGLFLFMVIESSNGSLVSALHLIISALILGFLMATYIATHSHQEEDTDD